MDDEDLFEAPDSADFFEAPEASNIERVFGADGLLAGKFNGYKPRPGQLMLAHAVEDAIRDGKHLMAEGPTGTGKSLAYSVPGIYHAIHSGKSVVIATANIALQEQLAAKDLPLLAEILPEPFSFAIIKGRNNYLCLDKAYENEARQGNLFGGSSKDAAYLDETGRRHLRVVTDWSKETKTGDVSELPFEPQQQVWSLFSTTSDECKADDCQFREDCFAFAARDAAREAQVIVTNYHLLFAHLQLRMMIGADVLLPEFDVALLDEAHKAADIARDFFGFKISPFAIKRLDRPLKQIGQEQAADELKKQSDRFFALLKAHRFSSDYKSRIRRANVVPHEDFTAILTYCGEAIGDYATKLANESKRAHGVTKIEDLPPKERGIVAGWKKKKERALEIAALIEQAMSWNEDSPAVYFIDADQRDNVSLCSKLIDVGGVLKRALFDHSRSVVMTSATLATGKSFDYVASEVGMNEYRECIAESPFTADQAMLVVPEMPEPNDRDNFPRAVADRVNEAIELARGRTLALFTSRKNMDIAYDRIKGFSKYRILKQGDMPRTALIEEFKRDTHSVLFGLESFWAGVDVPGESLSCVVIDRLPFPTPDDPVLDALSERDDDWFMHYSVPRAIIAFKQGFGRLIRSVSDRGVVVCLDTRIITKRYGKLFTSSLPPVRKSRRMESIKEFLDG